MFRFLSDNSTRPSYSRRVKCFAQLLHSQKFSIVFFFVGKPKKRPPSMRISILEQFGLAHFEIMTNGGSKFFDVNWGRKVARNPALA